MMNDFSYNSVEYQEISVKSEKARRSATGRPVADMDFRSRLGRVVRRYRLAAGFEQKDVAMLIGCSVNAVGGWELGRTAPSIDLIPRVCEVLDIPIYELMGIPAPLPVLPDKDEHILFRFHTLNEQNQNIVYSLMDQLIAEQDRKATEWKRREAELIVQFHERIPELIISSSEVPVTSSPDHKP